MCVCVCVCVCIYIYIIGLYPGLDVACRTQVCRDRIS